MAGFMGVAVVVDVEAVRGEGDCMDGMVDMSGVMVD